MTDCIMALQPGRQGDNLFPENKRKKTEEKKLTGFLFHFSPSFFLFCQSSVHCEQTGPLSSGTLLSCWGGDGRERAELTSKQVLNTQSPTYCGISLYFALNCFQN